MLKTNKERVFGGYLPDWDDTRLKAEYLSLMQSTDNLPIPGRIPASRMQKPPERVRSAPTGRKFKEM